MRDADSAFVTALSDARTRGLVVRRFLTCTVKDRDTGDPVELCYWTGDREIEIDVISGVTGAAETRTFLGGINLTIGNIPRTADLTIQTIDISMSGVAPACQALVRTYDARLAKVEVHVGLLDPRTRLPVADPGIEFLGEIDEAPIETGAAGGESTIQLKIRSDAISMLTRPNPRKRSYEGQKRRSGDEFSLYANSVKTWQVPWGSGVRRDA